MEQLGRRVARLGVAFVSLAGSLILLGGCARPGSGAAPTATQDIAFVATPIPSPPAGTRPATRVAPTRPVFGDGNAAAASPTPRPRADIVQPTATPAGTPPGERYEVQFGDTIVSIANEYGVDVEELIEINRLENPNSLRAGQVIIIPQR